MHRVALVLGILGGLFWISLPFYPSECVPVTGASEVFCNRLWTPALLAMLTGAAGICWLLRPRASRSVRWSLLAMTIGFAMMAAGNGLEYWVAFKLPHQGGIGGPIRGLLWMTAPAGWLVALVAACVAGVGLYRGVTGFALPRWPSLLFVLPLPLTLVFAALGPTWAGGIQLGLLGVLIGLYGLALPTRPSESP